KSSSPCGVVECALGAAARDNRSDAHSRSYFPGRRYAFCASGQVAAARGGAYTGASSIAGAPMRLFEPLYHRIMLWARHRHAPALLTLFSTAEAVFFPVPPEMMLAPMCLAQPRSGFRFASLSLAGSMVGAVIGYVLGYYAYEMLMPLFESLGWLERIDEQVTQLREIVAQSPWQAFWLLVLAGFTPIPLKIFTWASGIVGVP